MIDFYLLYKIEVERTADSKELLRILRNTDLTAKRFALNRVYVNFNSCCIIKIYFFNFSSSFYSGKTIYTKYLIETFT